MADKDLTDPLGRTVTLHDHTWYGHVVKRHPDMRPHRRLVELAVTDPLEIHISPTDADTRLYFGDGPRPGMMTLTVADVAAAFVKTAFVVGRPKGALEWSRPTP